MRETRSGLDEGCGTTGSPVIDPGSEGDNDGSEVSFKCWGERNAEDGCEDRGESATTRQLLRPHALRQADLACCVCNPWQMTQCELNERSTDTMWLSI